MAFLNNPFVGPRPLTRDNPIFGRDREIAELRHLLTAERFVLLLSPSGAGKSSLVNAGLIPELNSRFDVWEPTRVNTPPPPGITTNRYVWSTIHGWKGDGPETELASFVAARPRRQNILLIFDQFEEILRLNPADNAGRTEFFRQLGELLQSPSIWALLVLREDYLAPLLPWLSRLPTHFRSRFRLGFLSPPSAAEAMHCTAATGGRHFQPDALRQLTSRLADETGVIEPMHLQVVCRRLWERMPDDDLSIDGVDIDQFAGVTTSLAEYYATSVAAIARQFQISERAIRDWFQKELITASQTRGQVQQGPECSGTLPTPVAEAFLQTHLIRVEPRRKDWWYELAHDRLLEPVFQSNDSWYRDNLNTTQQRAVLWIEQHKPDALLLAADDLSAALAWLNAAGSLATPAEREFIDRSQQKYEAELESQRSAAREAALNLRLSALLARVAIKDGDSASAAGNPVNALAHYVRALRFQPDSDTARLGTARTLLSHTWPILARSFSHPAPISAMAVSPDFQTLAVAIDCERHEIWSRDSAALLHSEIGTRTGRPPGFPDELIRCPDGSLRLASTPDGPLFAGQFPFPRASVDTDTVHTYANLQQLFLWDLPSGSLIESSSAAPVRPEMELSSVLQIVASNRSLASAPPPFLRRSLASRWRSHGSVIRQRSVCSARFLPTGRVLETVDETGNLWVWDCPSGSPLHPSRPSNEDEVPLAVSRNGRFCLTKGSSQGIWDRIDRRFLPLKSLDLSNEQLVAVSPIGTHIAWTHVDSIRLSSPDGSDKRHLLQSEGPHSVALPLISLQFSTDGSVLSFVDCIGDRYFLDPVTAELLPEPRSNWNDDFPRFSIEKPDRSLVLIVPFFPGNEADLRTISGELVRPTISFSGEIRDVAFSPDCQYFVILAAGESSVQFRCFSTGAPVGPPLLHQEVALSAISSGQEFVIVESASGDPEAYATDSGAPYGSVSHFADVESFGFSPSGDHFFAISEHRAQSWNTFTCLPLSPPVSISCQDQPSLLLSPDGGKLLASNGFWDLLRSEYTPVPADLHAARFPHPQTDHIAAVWDPIGSAIFLAATITDSSNSSLPPIHVVSRWDFNSPLPQSKEILLDEPPVALACSLDAGYFAVVTRSGVARRFFTHSVAPAGPPFEVFPNTKSAALSPKGDSIVVTSQEGDLGIWNLESGLKSPRKLPDSPVTTAVFDTLGRNLLLTFPSAPPAIWNLRLARTLSIEYSEEPDSVIAPVTSMSVAKLPTGGLQCRHTRRTAYATPCSVGIPSRHTRFLYFGDGGALVTQSSRYLLIWSLSPFLRLRQRFAIDAPIDSALLSPDGRLLLVRSQGAGSRLYSLDSVPPQPIGQSLRGDTSAATFSPDGSCLLLGPESAPAEMYDTATFSRRPSTLPHPAPRPAVASLLTPRFHTVINASIAPDSRCVLTAAHREVRFWTIVRDLQPPPPPLLHDGPIRFLEFVPGNSLLYSTTTTGWLHFWNWPSLTPAGEPEHFPAGISSLAVGPHSPLLIGLPERTKRRPRPRWSMRHFWTDHLRFRECEDTRLVLFSPAGDLVLTLSADGFFRLWLNLDVSSDGPSIHIRGDSPFRTAAFHPAGTFFAAGDQAGQVTAFSRNTLCPIPFSVSHQASVRIVDFSPSGELLLSASDDGTAHLTRFPEGTPQAPPIVHSRAIRSACFHPSGRRLLTASEDRTAIIWDVDSGLPVSRPMKHKRTVTAAIFSPCGRIVATASLDGTASLWDADSGRPLAAPFSHPAPVHTLVFSPDGNSLITGSEDGALRCWPLFIDSGSPADATLLASLAEAIAGIEVNDDGDIVSLPDAHTQLQQTAAAIASTNGLFARFLPRFLPDFLWK